MAGRACIEQKNADKLRPGGNFVLLNSLLAFQPFSAACSPPDAAVFMPHSSLHPQHLSLPSHHSGCLNQMPGARYFRLIYQQFVYLKISNMRCASSSRCPMPDALLPCWPRGKGGLGVAVAVPLGRFCKYATNIQAAGDAVNIKTLG